jgi:hypothetical protein
LEGLVGVEVFPEGVEGVGSEERALGLDFASGPGGADFEGVLEPLFAEGLEGPQDLGRAGLGVRFRGGGGGGDQRGEREGREVGSQERFLGNGVILRGYRGWGALG